MYDKYSDDELIEAYTSMMEYSGEPSKEMQEAIDLRGGIESFKRKIEYKNRFDQETKRISKEIYSLTSKGTTVEFIKKSITSGILSNDQLSELIEKKPSLYKAALENRTVDSKTVIDSILAAIAAGIIGAVIFAALILFIPGMFIFFIVLIYIIDYLVIRLMTKKTRSNIIIFIATLLATIGSIILGTYFGNFFLPAG